MKTLLFAMLFLLYSQALSQTDARDKLFHNKLLIEKINPISNSLEQIMPTLSPADYRKNDSKRKINKTSYESGFLLVEESYQIWDGSNWKYDMKHRDTFNEVN